MTPSELIRELYEKKCKQIDIEQEIKPIAFISEPMAEAICSFLDHSYLPATCIPTDHNFVATLVATLEAVSSETKIYCTRCGQVRTI